MCVFICTYMCDIYTYIYFHIQCLVRKIRIAISKSKGRAKESIITPSYLILYLTEQMF